MVHTARDLTYGDLNGDGRLDIVSVNGSGGGQTVDDKNYVWLNEIVNDNHYVTVDVRLPRKSLRHRHQGHRVSRPGTNDLIGYDEVRTDFAYRSKRPATLHFGVGDADLVDVRLVLPDGTAVRYDNLATNAAYTLEPSLPMVIGGGLGVVAEGDEGVTTAEFELTLSAPSNQTVTVDWTPEANPENPAVAEPGVDYQFAGGTATFAPGETSATIEVEIYGDTDYEPGFWGGDWAFLRMSNPTNATLDPGSNGFGDTGIFIITNDDLPMVIGGGLGVVAEGDEGVTTAEFELTLSAPSNQTVTVDWTPEANPENPAVAEPGVDYQFAGGTATFAPGETSATIEVEIYGDTDYEPGFWGGDWAFLRMSNPTNATLDPGSNGFGDTGIFIITNDDTDP